MKSFTAHIKRVSLAVVALSSVMMMQGAYAVGTAANTDISNQATVNYKVGGADQPQASSNTTTFKVDRKVNLVVGGGNTTNTFPGATAALSPTAVATLFTVTNTGNGTDTFDLAATSTVNQTGDDFDVTALSIKYYRDNGTTPGVFDAGDTQITSLTLNADATVNVFIVADIPNTVTNNQNALVKLTATSTSAATRVGQVDDPLAVDVVIITQSSNANDTYHVQTAALAVLKSYSVVSDPITGVSANAKPIPGAVVEYTIQVTNSSSTTAADLVVVTDTFANTTSYSAGTVTKVGGSAVAPTDADVVGNTLTVPVGTLAASSSATVKFRVTINN